MRFIMGRPRGKYAKEVADEMEAFGDIVILDMAENMNSGKTHKYLTWAAENATVAKWEYPASGSGVPVYKGEKRPDYIVKADDDAFIMLGELERHLRVAPRNKAFWGYLVKNHFMGGECYALSLDLVQWISTSARVKFFLRGKEDKLVAMWLKFHPEKENIVWISERCWIYDTPQAGSVYSHGYLFPSQVAQIRRENATGLSPEVLAQRGGREKANAYSSVTRFQYYNYEYRDLRSDMSPAERIEGMIEDSPISRLREQRHGRGTTPSRKAVEEQFALRPSRRERFFDDPQERGGTVVVHFIKKTTWYLETMAAMLGPGAETESHWGARAADGELAREEPRVLDAWEGDTNAG